jgi:hypothetical protein
VPKTRQQRRARARSPVAQRRRGAITFLVFLLLLLIGGGYLVTLFRTSPPPLTRGASIGEHWHASYRIYVCGQRVTNYPTVEGELHSHGDGFMHIHPSTPNFSGDNASLGSFLRLYETALGVLPNGKRTLIFPDGTSYTDGGRCPGSRKRYNVELLNKGKRVESDPGKFRPHEGDTVVIRFGPQGERPMPNPFSKAKGIPEPPPQPGPEATRAPD